MTKSNSTVVIEQFYLDCSGGYTKATCKKIALDYTHTHTHTQTSEMRMELHLLSTKKNMYNSMYSETSFKNAGQIFFRTTIDERIYQQLSFY